MKDYFKFIIKLPKEDHSSFDRTQTAAIITQAPTLYVMWRLDPGLDSQGQIELAKAQLKLAMIDCLMNGEWEIERD
jgi:hypothetical protein